MGWLKFWGFVLLCLAFLASVTECKKTKKKKSSVKKKKVDMNGNVDSSTLKCLVCRSVVEEFESAIYMVDPKKIVDGGYHFREGPSGSNQGAQPAGSRNVPYARSQTHLNELIETICENMEEYSIARWKKNGNPTVIRKTGRDGNRNPRFGKVNFVSDQDPERSALKAHCQTIVEDNEDELTSALAKDNANAVDEICVNRTNICKNSLKDEL